MTIIALRRPLLAIGHQIGYAVQDLSRGKVFWIPVLTAIVPTILGALAISSNGSRLVVAIDVKGPIYRAMGTTLKSQYEYEDALSGAIKSSLAIGASALFEANQNIAPDHQPDSKRTRDALFPEISFVARTKVTNIGAKPSSVSTVTYYIVERTSDDRDTLTYVDLRPEDVALPEGRPVVVSRPEGDVVGVWGGGVARFVDYETVNVLRRKISEAWPQRPPADILSVYLQLIALSTPDHQTRLLGIANSKRHAQIIFGVEVVDIYGRSARAERVVTAGNFGDFF